MNPYDQWKARQGNIPRKRKRDSSGPFVIQTQPLQPTVGHVYRNVKEGRMGSYEGKRPIDRDRHKYRGFAQHNIQTPYDHEHVFRDMHSGEVVVWDLEDVEQ